MRSCLLALALVHVLIGCATTSPLLPGVAKSAVTQAEVVVTTSCVTTIPVEPAWAGDALPAGADEFQKVRALAAEHLQRKQYVPQLMALLNACQ